MEKLENSPYFRELQTALEAAEKAGKIIDSYAGNADNWSKDDGSVVTEADLKCQEKIVETIKEKFPADGFLGEEENLEPEEEDRIWIIDPIDGTFNFDSGFPIYCVSIALEVNEEIVLGVVHLPKTSRDETYFAVRNKGSYKKDNGEGIKEAGKIKVSNHSRLNEAQFFITTFDIYEGELDQELEIFEKLARKSGVQRQLGACAVELCFVGSGKADFIINPICNKWDWAASKPIIEEAGGELRIKDSCFPDSYEVIASNGILQKEVEKVVSDTFE